MKLYLLAAAALAASTAGVSAANPVNGVDYSASEDFTVESADVYPEVEDSYSDPEDLSFFDEYEDEEEEELVAVNRNPATCKHNCACPFDQPSCTFAVCEDNCKCNSGSGCAMPACKGNCKCQLGGCAMPVCTNRCKCTGGGCTLPGEQDEFFEAMEQEPKGIGETGTHAAAVLADEEFSTCVTPAFNGEDQRGCGPGAVCMGASGNQGCNQEGLVNPSCVTSGCNQQNAINPSCVGSKCDQRGAHNPSCTGSNCCWDKQTKNGSCTWGCGHNAKGCPRRAEEVKTFLRSG